MRGREIEREPRVFEKVAGAPVSSTVYSRWIGCRGRRGNISSNFPSVLFFNIFPTRSDAVFPLFFQVQRIVSHAGARTVRRVNITRGWKIS